MKTIALLTELAKSSPGRRAINRADLAGEIRVRFQYPPFGEFDEEALAGCDGLVCRPTDDSELTLRHVAKANRPFFAATLSTGIEHLDALRADPTIHVIRSEKSGNAGGAAELALLHAMLLLRPAHVPARAVEQGTFDKTIIGRVTRPGKATRVEGKVWMTIGAGHHVTQLLPRILMLGVRQFIVWHPKIERNRLLTCLEQVPRECLAAVTEETAGCPVGQVTGLGGQSMYVVGARRPRRYCECGYR